MLKSDDILSCWEGDLSKLHTASEFYCQTRTCATDWEYFVINFLDVLAKAIVGYAEKCNEGPFYDSLGMMPRGRPR
jgi:hypothetical protein